MSNVFETILLSKDDNGIATLTINRPDKLNALNAKVLEELSIAMNRIEGDDEIKAVVITGAGEKAFVAGADIKELSDLNKEEGEKLSAKGQQIFFQIENCSKPVIAVVNGYALGGGAELAMACHIRIATDNAVFGLPEVSLGLIPGYGGTQRLAALIGKAKAFEYVLTAGQIKADEALSIGLANRVADGDGLEEATELCKKILRNGPLAVSKAIKAVNSSGESGGFQIEAQLFGELCSTKDFKEGTTAFLEKRKPDFSGK